ncbi:hypothetical protein AAHK07_09335 [Aliarcobacter cryaerophilus]|uniref:hypothetical protein n=1 Tax=Aliarcobacter cryaerophilus TaxID=28198 RepID=UPI0031806586
MSAVDFEVLKLIPKMLEEMQDLKKEVTELKQHIKPEYDLTKRAGVMSYLKVSNNTITRYISEGIFKEGYHYHRELKNNASKIIFVSGAIEEFKKEKTK